MNVYTYLFIYSLLGTSNVWLRLSPQKGRKTSEGSIGLCKDGGGFLGLPFNFGLGFTVQGLRFRI